MKFNFITDIVNSISKGLSKFTDCPPGTYGPNCVYNCSGKCLDGVACNRTTGKCDTGCVIGYTGVLCNTGLIQSNGDLLKYER